MGLKVGILEISVVSGSPSYRHAYMTAHDSRRLIQLLKARSGCTWEDLSEKLAYGDAAGTNLIRCAAGQRALAATRAVSIVRLAANQGWLTPEEVASVTGAIACSRDQVEADTAEAAFLTSIRTSLKRDLTQRLGLSGPRANALAHCSASRLLFDAKMAISDDLLLFDRLAYGEPDLIEPPAPRRPPGPYLH